MRVAEPLEGMGGLCNMSGSLGIETNDVSIQTWVSWQQYGIKSSNEVGISSMLQ